MNDIRKIEMTLAYDMACSLIAGECLPVVEIDTAGITWYDTYTAERPLEDAVEYLDSRRLLTHHPKNPHWVAIHDEDEPRAEEVPCA